MTDSLDADKEYSGTGGVVVLLGGMIIGEAVDSSTNAGIAKATISVLETGADYLSAQNGFFEIMLPFGKYALSISKAGYVSDIVKVILKEETLNLGLVTLDPGIVSISGTVVDLAGNGITGADVFAVGLQGGKPKVFSSTKTENEPFPGEEGKFTLWLNIDATYDLIAKKAGYADSPPRPYAAGVTDAVVTLGVIINSSEQTVGDLRIITIEIDDRGVLALPTVVTLREIGPEGAKRLGKGTLSPVARPAVDPGHPPSKVWELTYTPKIDGDDPDRDGHRIGILVRPLGAEEQKGRVRYSFIINPTPSVKSSSKMVQTTIDMGIIIVGKPLGQVLKDGVVVDPDDGTNFVLDPDNLTTPVGASRALNLTRFELADSPANQAVQTFQVTPMSEVYDFAFIDPDTGEEHGNEVSLITVKIKVNLAIFDPDNWAPMISHNLADPNSWYFTEVVPGVVFFDGQYLSFDLTTLYGQGVVMVSLPPPPVLIGDITGDGLVDLKDAIFALKILSCASIGQPITLGSDVNSDGRIDLSEVIFILQKLAGLR